MVIEITKQMPNNYAVKHLVKQLLRSGTSGPLNYGEAQSGENLVPGKTAQRIVTSGEAGTLVYFGLRRTHSN